MRKATILLDTNVWRYIVDAGAVEEIRASAREAAVHLVVAPAVLYEAARTTDVRLRRHLVEVLTRGSWPRLMSEVYLQADDFVAAVRARRPAWLRVEPDRRGYYRLRSDWSGGAFWKRARRDTDGEIGRLASMGSWRLAQARKEARDQRDEFHRLGIRKVDLEAAWAELQTPAPGLKGRRVAPWRVDSANVWHEGLLGAQDQTPYTDWVAPWIDVRRVAADREGWASFWLREVDDHQVPREWIRWAVGAMQATRRFTDGTPWDNAIATYLPDVDYFATADKTFADIVTIVAPSSPTRLATVWRLPGGATAVSELNELFMRKPEASW